MKKIFTLTLITIVVIALIAGCQNQNANKEQNVAESQTAGENKIFTAKFSTDRTVKDYKEELKKLVNADEVGEVIHPDNNDVRYPFVPLKKGGKIFAYGSWVRTIIYQHPEDMIAVVSPDVKILKWKPLDASDHHPELKKEEYLKRFYNLTLDKTFDPSVDVISGSTISSDTFFFELRNILVSFKLGPGKPKEES